MGTKACPGSPLCLTDMSVFSEIPKVVNYSGLGTQTGSKPALVSTIFFLKVIELGKNATDEFYSSSKWSFWQANIKICLILVYWDAKELIIL
jgi:hypothetical protein